MKVYIVIDMYDVEIYGVYQNIDDAKNRYDHVKDHTTGALTILTESLK